MAAANQGQFCAELSLRYTLEKKNGLSKRDIICVPFLSNKVFHFFLPLAVIAVLVPVGVVLLGVIAFVIFRSRQKSKGDLETHLTKL